MPNFLIIGTAKAGTTALYQHLKQHPQIYMSPVKEPAFFATEDEKLNVCSPSGKSSYLFSSIEAYQELFRGASNEKAIGEASTVYLYSSKAAERIKRCIPDVKLIVILRNPVERAYAQFLHSCREGFEPLADFAQALQEEESRISNKWRTVFHYKQRGFYYLHLKRYLNIFEPSQIQIYLYEDFNANPDSVIQDVFSFLGVDDTFSPDLSLRYNVSGIPKNKALHALYRNLKSLLPKELLSQLRQSVVPQILFSLQSKNLIKQQLSDEVRKELTQVYREDTLKLQDLIQQDLSIWLKQ